MESQSRYEFNYFAQINRELDDFFKSKIHIAGAQQALYQPSSLYSDDIAYLSRNNKNYNFSQWETLNLIDLYYNSKFETGKYDTEGQVKVFLNISKFRSQVASKMTKIDTKDFVFIPEEGQGDWGPWLLTREFKDWTKTHYFAELLSDLNDNLPKYGTVVFKKAQGKLQRLKLSTLRNQQDADSLQTATYVIEEHKDMTLGDMAMQPGWDVSSLDMTFGQRTKVFERYGKVPMSFYKQMKGMEVEEGDEYKEIETMGIVTLHKIKDAKGDAQYGGQILFFEAILRRPYEEVHWDKQDGRWLGIGEIENQFENQKFRNMIVNFRRRSLMWGSKKIFQSADDTVARNLVKDVRDGEVLRIMPNGEITQVNMSTPETSEYTAAENIIDKNADQVSFTYEAATGASMPSGTPFRLGIQMANAVKGYYDGKQTKIGSFLKCVVDEFIMPDFKKQNTSEHWATLFGDGEGIEELRQVMVETQTDAALMKHVLSGGLYRGGEQTRQEIEQKLSSSKHVHVKIPDNFYDTIKHRTALTITGEDVDVKQQIETLTNLYQILSQKGDPRADKVLARVMSLAGQNIGAFGKPASQQPAQALNPMQMGSLARPQQNMGGTTANAPTAV